MNSSVLQYFILDQTVCCENSLESSLSISNAMSHLWRFSGVLFEIKALFDNVHPKFRVQCMHIIKCQDVKASGINNNLMTMQYDNVVCYCQIKDS